MRTAAVTEHGRRSTAVIGALTLSLAVAACAGGGGGGRFGAANRWRRPAGRSFFHPFMKAKIRVMK